MLVISLDQAFSLIKSLPGKEGASQEEIAAVEQSLGVRFPSTFRTLLDLTGRSMSWLYPHGCASCDKLPEFQLLAQEIAADSHNPQDLHPHDVAFDQFQGELFMFFRADGQSDDPVVYTFRESSVRAESTRLTLGAYIVEALNRYLEPREENQPAS